jgi:hypothetical protein
VRESDDGGFGDERMRYERGLDLHRAQTMARDVDDVVDSADDHEIAVLVAVRAVAGQIPVLLLELGPVHFLEPVVVAVQSAQHGRPGLAITSSPLCSSSTSLPSSSRSRP